MYVFSNQIIHAYWPLTLKGSISIPCTYICKRAQYSRSMCKGCIGKGGCILSYLNRVVYIGMSTDRPYDRFGSVMTWNWGGIWNTVGKLVRAAQRGLKIFKVGKKKSKNTCRCTRWHHIWMGAYFGNARRFGTVWSPWSYLFGRSWSISQIKIALEYRSRRISVLMTRLLLWIVTIESAVFERRRGTVLDLGLYAMPVL